MFENSYIYFIFFLTFQTCKADHATLFTSNVHKHQIQSFSEFEIYSPYTDFDSKEEPSLWIKAQQKVKKSFCKDNFQETISIFDYVTHKMKFNPMKEIVLVLGNSNSGKSKLTHFLFGDNSKMHAVENTDGSFDIFDDHDNILGESPIIIPELVIDKDTSTMIYDCPSFRNTHCNSFGIIGQYFLKQVIDFADAVKFIFVLEYSTFLEDSGRNFEMFLTYVTNLIPNILVYNNSFVMVVTKVPNIDDNYLENVLEYIENFISRSVDNQKQIFLENLLNLPENILFSKIITKNGTFDNNDNIKVERYQIRSRIDNLTYTFYNPSDFKYGMSKELNLMAGNLKQVLSANAVEQFIEVTVSMYYQILEKVNEFRDFKLGRNFLENSLQIIEELHTSLEEIQNLSHSTNIIIEASHALKVSISRIHLTNFHLHVKFLKFLMDVSNESVDTRNFFSTLNSVKNVIIEQINWHSYLAGLTEFTSEYEFHNIIVSEYTVILPDSLPFDNFKLDDFLIYWLENVSGYEVIKNVSLSESQFKEICSILNFAFKNVTFSTKNDILTINGNFINIKQINNLLEIENYNFVEILASHTFFLDEDFKLPGQNLAIISPNFWVINETKIDLTGENADSFIPQKAISATTGTDGKNGKSGNPGQNGGSFFVFGKIFYGLENLVIVTNGGNGGTGQEGGDGFDGIEGNDPGPLPSDFYGYFNSKTTNITSENIMHGFSDRWEGHNFTYTKIKDGVGCTKGFQLTLHGKPGIVATEGGAGGSGGFGGNPGLVLFSEQSSIKLVNKYGFEGLPGIDGNKGNCSRDNFFVEYHICINWYKPNYEFYAIEKKYLLSKNAPPCNKFKCILPKEIKLVRSRNCRVGKNDDYKCPQPVNYTHFHNALSNFKLNLMHEPHLTQYFSSFQFDTLNDLSMDQASNNLYTIKALYSELILLEKQQLTQSNPKLLSQMYKFIMKRCLDLIIDTPLNERISLVFLYTSSLTSFVNLKPRILLVTNVNDLFESLKEDILSLKTQQKILLNNNKMIQYNSITNEKIVQANVLIETQVMPAIEISKELLDIQINKLLSETLESEKETINHTQTLIRNKGEFKKKAVLRAILSVFKCVASLGAAFGSTGQVIGSVVTLGANIAETATAYRVPEFRIQKGFKIPDSTTAVVSGLVNSARHFEEKQFQAINNQLEELGKSVAKYPEEIGDLNAKVESLKDKAKNLNLNKESLGKKQFQKEAGKIQKEIDITLKERSKILKQNDMDIIKHDQLVESKKNLKSTEVVRNLEKVHAVAVPLASEIFNTINTINMDEEQIKEMEREIRAGIKSIKELQKFEQMIYSDVIPIIVGMHNELLSFQNEAKNLSEVSLNVGKWQVQSKIREIRFYFRELTEGFSVKEGISHILDKLDEAMAILINVYDQIQEYEEQKRLTDFISVVSSPAFENVNTDPDIQVMHSKLKIIIKSNIILSHYNQGYEAFRTLVFPFANHFLQEFEIPWEMQHSFDYENLVDFTVEKISKIKNKLGIYKSTVQHFDKDILTGSFDSRNVSSYPFYVWNSQSWSSSILDLLSGKSVTLLADVRKSAPGKNAIKFTEIKLNFKSKDSKIQQMINSELENFYINMTHDGMSYYKCDDEYYVISGSKVEFTYSNSFSNIVFDKVSKGDFLLSPYTMWTFSIHNLPGNLRSFSRLKYLASKINLELVGKGRFLMENTVDFKELELNKYYDRLDFSTDVNLNRFY